MGRSIFLLAALGAALASCATAPEVYDFPKSRVVPDGKDAVWERVVEFFAANNLSIKTIEKDSGIVAAERMITSPRGDGTVAAWASCGAAPLEVPVRQAVDLNVFVKPQGAGTQVTVNTRITEMRQFANDPLVTVTCNSNGTLERMVLDAAQGR